MSVLAQLRLLLWKNWLQQIRSPWFTLMEFFVPLLLIGSSFGLMIGLRKRYEANVLELEYDPWFVMGNGYDMVTPIDTYDYSTAIIDFTQLYSPGTENQCDFLKLTKYNSTSFRIDIKLIYTPNTTTTYNIMKEVKRRYSIKNMLEYIQPFYWYRNLSALNLEMNMDVEPFETEKEMVSYATNSFSNQCGNPLLGGIVFDDSISKNIDKSKELNYTIRLSNTRRRCTRYTPMKTYTPWDTSQLFAIQYVTGPINVLDTDGGYPGYWKEGFMTIQRAVNMAIRLEMTGNTLKGFKTDLMVGRFPFPSYNLKIIEIGAFFIPVVIIFSYMTSVIYIVRSVVMEKENNLKEYMRVMGLSQWVHWIGYFLVNFVKLAFSVIVLTVLMHSIVPKSDASILFVFFLLYAYNALYFSFAISTFMQSGTAATMMAVAGWMLLYFWYAIFNSIDIQRPIGFGIRMLNFLNPDSAMSYGITLLAQYETQSKGLHWNQLFSSLYPSQQVTMGHCFIMLIVDGLILMILTWYIEAVYPGGEGVPQKPWFFVLPSYWFPYTTAKRQNPENQCSGRMEYQEKFTKIESEPNLKATINIVNLSKTYGTSFFKKCFDCKFGKSGEKKAVEELNLKMYHGQITALLGHNGAGKSTTFSMLTGVTAPSYGTAYIDDYDIRTNLPQIRKQMGLCPQYNILFSFLTIMEHLEFFCKLKGRIYNKMEALEILTRLKLDFKKDARAGTLSGGQKRKLSLAIALIGGSEILMLDEPTSGMDPWARHETWTLLQSEKSRRTILLTTHFMEEADLLGDRIAIMAHGQLQCCGSGMFLKAQYGDGYHLTVVYGNVESEKITNYATETLKLLKNFADDTKKQSLIGQEATFLLSTKSRPIFPSLFSNLEENQSRLGINSFGVSITTMEEVFLKVSDIAEERFNSQHEDEAYELPELNPEIIQNLKVIRRLTGFPYYLQHAKAMFIKRTIYFLRKWTIFLSQLLFPVFYLALMIWASQMVPSAKEQPSLRIDLSPFASKGQNGYILTAPIENNLTSPLNKTMSYFHASPNLYIQEEDDIEKYVIETIPEIGSRTFGIHYPLAFTFSKQFKILRAYFNNFGYTTPPLAISISDSMILSKKLDRDIAITVSNHPLPPVGQDSLKNKNYSDGAAFLISYAIIVCMAVVVAGYSQFLIRERKKKSKHMQMLSGLRPWMYWGSAFVWDVLWYIIRMGCFIAIFYIFNIEQYTKSGTTVCILILSMVLYGWTSIPFTYWFSFMFTSAPKGFTLIVMYNIISGMIGSVAVPIISQTMNKDVAHTWSIILSWFFPTYSIANIFSIVYNNEFSRQACAQIDCKSPLFNNSTECCGTGNQTIFTTHLITDTSRKGILIPLLFFAVQGFIFWFFIFTKENGLFGRILTKLNILKKKDRVKDVETLELKFEDSDVIDEKSNVKRLIGSGSNTAVVVNNLKKWYGKFNAVKGVNFHVNTGECFGLLGVNGAGKTSTFQMLTGENEISEGDAYIKGWSVKNNWREAGANIGYCPQFDAIIKEMSGEETLYMFARIRGIAPNEIPEKVKAVIRAIGIGIYAKRQIKTYSGGNKRRISLGIALIGLPDILLLDEPTTGVDPRARRIIWNILSKVRELGTALVLTSHSMEECEALCTELAIMVYGQFRCYGSCQHIKSRYGVGFTLLIRLQQSAELFEAKQSIMKTFPNAILKEEHIQQLNYELPRTNGVTWSSLFDKIEDLSQRMEFDDYSLSQTTLEQVFLDFSRDATISIQSNIAGK